MLRQVGRIFVGNSGIVVLLIRAKKCWQRWPKKLGVEFESGLGLGMHIIKGKYHIKCVSQC